MKKNEFFNLFKSCFDDNDYINYNEAATLAKFADIATLDYGQVMDAVRISNNIKAMYEEQRNNVKIYSDLLTNYKKILDKTTVLARELNLKNSLQFSILYTYLLHNGYFSKDKNLSIQTEERKLISGLYALDIMAGKGVCLNFSEMLKDFLTNSGFNSATIASSITYKNLILKKLLIKNPCMTHAFNLITENGKIYIYDSTNLFFLKIQNTTSAKIIVGAHNFKYKHVYKYKLYPYDSYFLNINPETFGVLDTLNTRNDFNSPYDSENYIQIQQTCIDEVVRNEKLILDYYDCTKEHIDTIANRLELIPNK